MLNIPKENNSAGIHLVQKQTIDPRVETVIFDLLSCAYSCSFQKTISIEVISSHLQQADAYCLIAHLLLDRTCEYEKVVTFRHHDDVPVETVP